MAVFRRTGENRDKIQRRRHEPPPIENPDVAGIRSKIGHLDADDPNEDDRLFRKAKLEAFADAAQME